MEFGSMFELIHKFREVQQSGHPVCSLDSQEHHRIGFYDVTAREWYYVMLHTAKGLCYETDRCWKDVGLTNLEEAKEKVRILATRQEFFGETLPDVLEESKTWPVDQDSVMRDTGKILDGIGYALAESMTKNKSE